METTILQSVMQETIQQILQLLPPSKDNITEHLQDFYEIVRRKLSETPSAIKNDIKTKLEAIRKKENKTRECLENARQFYRKEIEFKNEIIIRNCSLIIQLQEQHYKLMETERISFEYEIASHQKALHSKMQQLYKRKTTQLIQELERSRTTNMLIEKEKRNQWNEKKLKLNDVLLKYDTQMLEQEEKLESTRSVLETEEKELEHYKTACASQESMYYELMREKEEYLEEQRQQKLYEIRVKIARRTIIKFIEDNYPSWKKKKLKALKKKSKYRFNTSRSKEK